MFKSPLFSISLVVLLMIAGIIVVMSSTSQADCTIQTAQLKMVEVTNMISVYNRENIEFLKNKQTPPASFSAKYDALVEEYNELQVEFADDMESNTQLELDNKIDQSICDRYDALFKAYAPDGYQNSKITLQQTTQDPNCNTTALWDKYGVLIQKQAKLTLAGKMDDVEQVEAMRLSTEIGQYSTTDISKACLLLNDFDTLINSQ